MYKAVKYCNFVCFKIGECVIFSRDFNEISSMIKKNSFEKSQSYFSVGL